MWGGGEWLLGGDALLPVVAMNECQTTHTDVVLRVVEVGGWDGAQVLLVPSAA